MNLSNLFKLPVNQYRRRVSPSWNGQNSSKTCNPSDMAQQIMEQFYILHLIFLNLFLFFSALALILISFFWCQRITLIIISILAEIATLFGNSVVKKYNFAKLLCNYPRIFISLCFLNQTLFFSKTKFSFFMWFSLF